MQVGRQAGKQSIQVTKSAQWRDNEKSYYYKLLYRIDTLREEKNQRKHFMETLANFAAVAAAELIDLIQVGWVYGMMDLSIYLVEYSCCVGFHALILSYFYPSCDNN